MPISAENRKRYPKDWQDIRDAIQRRAESRCEFCGVPDGAWIVRDHDPGGATFTLVNTGAVHDATTGELLGYARRKDYTDRKKTRVILTTAHLDHTPEHNDPSNLRALCCRCHLLHDAAHHRQSAWQRPLRSLRALARNLSTLDAQLTTATLPMQNAVLGDIALFDRTPRSSSSAPRSVRRVRVGEAGASR